ncbi:MAG TPA: hypothetical protein VFQ65_00205, partial [Kofleriaceae bacterium]|nr:hypothetical protein [Kofleriaceae bacterium]
NDPHATSEQGPSNEHPQATASSTERTSSDPSPTPKTEPNQSTQHTSPETKPEEHPHQTADSTPRATDKSPVAETTPKETGGTTVKDPAEDRPTVAATEPNKNEAPQRQLHEPPTKQISEHEPRLKAIEHNPDGASPAAVEAVREARAEIKRLKNLRTRAENATGVWEHATPEERAARVKTLEDQIKTTADRAVEQYDRVANQPGTDAEVLGRIQNRSPEQVEARAKEVAQARDEIKKRDADLVRQVNGNVETDAAGKIHVKQVYDHVTLGSGFAGTANETSRPNVKPGDIVIGGPNPWDGATSKFGQGAGQSEVPNHQPGHGMIETSSDPNRRYMLASEHADNVALNKNDAQVKTYNGTSGSLEPGPKPEWPAWAREGGANARMEVTDPDGTKRYFYTKQADVASGPGPNRRLPESVMDADTMKRMKDAKAFAFGDQAFGSESVKPGEVANIGAGAAGAWGSEAAAHRLDENGVRVNDVEWIGTHPDEAKQNAGTQRDKLAAINRELADAQTAQDAPRIKAAQDALTKFTFEEAARNGNLPRNREPGAAFDPHMQKGNTSPEGVQGNISRRVVEGIDKITYEPEVPGGPDRVKIVLKEKGPNGEPVVLWKDSLVLSIGQDAKGKGGPVELVKNYQGKLLPIYGEPDATGFKPIVGVRSEDGSVRVLGAAS